jgi:bacterial/archaeal transporter family-2 protein
MQILMIFFAVLAGLTNPFQSAANAQLNKQVMQPVWVATCTYVTGLLVLLVIQAFRREALPGANVLGQVPWWAWMGGFVSIFGTMGGLLLAQKLGSGIFTGVNVTAAVVCSLTLDHFGLVGFKQHTASPMRMLGAALMIGGLWLVARF